MVSVTASWALTPAGRAGGGSSCAKVSLRRTSSRESKISPHPPRPRRAGEPLQPRKSPWTATAQRRPLLAVAGIRLADALGTAGATAGVADVLDAAAAAWTALGVAQGRTRPTPDPPETFSDGLPAAIWS